MRFLTETLDRAAARLKRGNAVEDVLRVTFDVKAYLSRDGGSSGDDDDADVEPGVGLLGVVDVEGDVGGGHGHAEAHPLGELVLAEADLT